MRKNKYRSLPIIVLMLLVLPLSTRAAAWDQPIDLNITKSNSTDYRHLDGLGSVVYYRVAVTAPTTTRFVIRTSRTAPKLFAPQIVVFQSSEGTYGPLLPIAQPPQTMAIVYGQTTPQVSFDASTQTLSSTCLSQLLSFPVAGSYLVAVYNAGSQSGSYKLIINPSSALGWSDAFRLPKDWAQDQLYAGFGWLTFITPTILLLIGWLVYLRLDHHQLHPHKSYGSPTTKVVAPIQPKTKPKRRTTTRASRPTTRRKQ